MFRRVSLLWILPLLLLVGILGWILVSKTGTAPEHFTVISSRFEKWTPLAGKLEAKNSVSLRSELDGLSKITWLIDDGTPVLAGDPVARFDPSELEEKKLILARDIEMAEAELHSLSLAQHPLEISRLESEVRNLQAQLQEESSLRKDTEELVRENLLPAEELHRHDIKIKEYTSDIQGMIQQLDLTRNILHPSLEKKAEARLHAAKTAHNRVAERLQNTEVPAPSQGTVLLPRIPIDGERRLPRVGDGLYKNQVFMEIADLTELVVRSSIQEQALSRIVPGQNALVHFPAYPGKRYRASVSRVGTHPNGDTQDYPLTLQLSETSPTLRPGLTAEVEVLEFVKEDALLVPRKWITYQEGSATILRKTAGRTSEIKKVILGDGTPTSVIVTEGIQVGDILVQP